MKNQQRLNPAQITPDEIVPVVLIRHAQSQWNRENRFTGWADPQLTEKGIVEARAAGSRLHKAGYHFDVALSSRLQRARTTLDIILEKLGQTTIPKYEAWELNERHYGALQGLDKSMATERHGEHQVWRWRRGYTDRADPLHAEDQRHPCHDPLCRDIDPNKLPQVESLAETRARVMGYWHEKIEPRIRRGERLLISTHGNTLRALIMDLAGMSPGEVESLEIPTATPIVFNFNRKAAPLEWSYIGGPDKRAA